MATRRTLPTTLATLVAALTLALAGCGPQFDPPSTIDTLRILAVQKDRPYAAPGDEVHLNGLRLTVETTDGRRVGKVLAVRDRDAGEIEDDEADR